MLVYICCSGGATSSLFCQSIGKASEKNVLVDHIFIILKDLENLLNTYDMILAYGPAELLNERSVQKYHLDQIIKSVWICPQSRYLKEGIYKALDPYDIPVHLVDMRAFGTMNGKKALEDIEASL
ncbi:PTS sugar transporter subunit IIB [Candidatus Stoquefichus sp. SB1]|jgi:PTS system cellobiose-specific IIB component|uniref:PTS sugar transporter subunit IIB n=1 Tax=Candidatus Stoquefichus sp. SB1 TaxID=1658109 RepID=UPI00067F2FFD|nr:PTS beta-glucoside transporter subunit IIB [Candidatus Stoquefichus sp. SB1]